MPLLTRYELETHPKARLIPLCVFEDPDCFLVKGNISIISDEELLFINTEPEKLADLLNRAKSCEINQKVRIWLALAFTHPELTDAFLNEVAEAFKLPALVMLRLAVTFNNASFLNMKIKSYHENNELLNLLTAENHFILRKTAELGYVDTLNALLKITHERTHQSIDWSHAFFVTANAGDLAMVKRLCELMPPEKILAKIQANNFDLVRWVASHVQLIPKKTLEFTSILKIIIDIVAPHTPQIHNLIRVNNFYVIACITCYADIQLFNHILELTHPHDLQTMLSTLNYFPFRQACSYGNLDLVNRMIDIVSPDNLFKMLNSEHDASLIKAASDGHKKVVRRLLQVPDYFSYVERHGREFQEKFIKPFISQEISELEKRIEIFYHQNPHGKFDISTPDEAKLCFFILRHLIQQKDTSKIQTITLLLSFPSIIALAATEVTPGMPNELLRVALRVDFKEAAQRLVNIPSVKKLAEEKNYYPDEVRGGFDLRALAKDINSSITPLTVMEDRRLLSLHNHYKPIIQTRGIHALMMELRHELMTLYHQKPATICVQENDQSSGKSWTLPVDWSSFTAMPMSAMSRHKAKKSYHEHKIHTALRFISKPNYWLMSGSLLAGTRSATYVITDPHVPDHQWSYFIEFEELIVLFWLAAKDPDFPPLDGYDLEGRTRLFYEELALIGRAQNFISTRMIKDTLGNTIEEEFDNYEEGDDPSCPSGIKRRLFQSVQSHPLLMIITQEHIQQALNSFVYNHFKCVVNDKNRELLARAWENYTQSPNEKDAKTLKLFDISKASQKLFFDSLVEQHGVKFTEDPDLVKFAHKFFEISEKEAHAVTLGHAGMMLIFPRSVLAPEKKLTPSIVNPFDPASFVDKKTAIVAKNHHSIFTINARPLLTHPSAPQSHYSTADFHREINTFVFQHFKEEITPRKKEKISMAWYRYQTLPNTKDLTILRKLNIPRAKQDSFYQALVAKYGWSEQNGFIEATVRQVFFNRPDCFHAKTFAASIGLERLLSPPQPTTDALSGVTTEKSETSDSKTREHKRSFDQSFFSPPAQLQRNEPDSPVIKP